MNFEGNPCHFEWRTSGVFFYGKKLGLPLNYGFNSSIVSDPFWYWRDPDPDTSVLKFFYDDLFYDDFEWEIFAFFIFWRSFLHFLLLWDPEAETVSEFGSREIWNPDPVLDPDKFEIPDPNPGKKHRIRIRNPGYTQSHSSFIDKKEQLHFVFAQLRLKFNLWQGRNQI